MKEKFTEKWNKVKEFFANASKRTRILIGAGAAVILIAIVAIIILLAAGSKPVYSVLFTGLNADEATAVVTYLNENGYTDYQLQGNDTILVPEQQESLLKAKLLMEGYPTSGYNYSSYFDNVGALSTEAERNKAFLLALQEEMRAVIRCFDGVKDATVFIAQGEDHRYVLDSSNLVAATASVTLTMETGKTLTKAQADAIRRLVSHGVQGLSIENVTIEDTFGNTYTGSETADTQEASQLKLQLEEDVNNSVRSSVMQILVPIFGEDNVRVSVRSTVDVTRVTGDSITYEEPDWAADGSTNGEGIIGSKVFDYELIRNEDGTVGGVVGTETNADLPTYVEELLEPDGSETGIIVSGQTDYNVDTHREQTIRVAGVVTDLMVSVSINSTTAGNVDTLGLTQHVARAAGIAEDDEGAKISILALPFYVTPGDGLIAPEGLPSWMLYAAIGGVLLLIVLLAIIISIARRKKRKKLLDAEEAQKELEAMLLQQQMEERLALANVDVMNLASERSVELRQDIREFAEENPEIAVQLLRSWMKGDDKNV